MVHLLRFLSVAPILLTSSAGSAGAPKVRRHTSARLGISFPVPAGWSVSPCTQHSSEAAGCLALREPNSGSTDPSVRIEVKPGNLDETLLDHGLFEQEKEGGQWVKHGRYTTVKVVSIRAKGWKGVYAVADCGVSDELGFHAGAGECLTAVLSDGRRSVIIETDGIADTDLVLATLVKGLKLLR